MKIEITKSERTLIIAALIAYMGVAQETELSLLNKLIQPDPAEDGPEVEILRKK